MNNQKKILIIDDEADVRNSLKMRLDADGFIVFAAEDGTEGVKVAEREVPDLIVLDIVMPQMDGYTCLKEIRRLPKIKDVLVLMLSGKEEDKVRDLFAFQKISGYIEKPFRLDDVVWKIEDILKMSSTNDRK